MNRSRFVTEGENVQAVVWAIGVVLALLLLAANYMCSLAIVRRRKQFLADNPDLAGVGTAFTRDWLDQYRPESVSITSADGLTLRGLWLPADQPAGRTAILAHGYASRGVYMGRWAEFYHSLGYNALLPDARGHGDSEGCYICFGWPDRLDCLRWIDLVISRNGPGCEIVLHGVSMGGATVLMTSGEALPENVRCAVSDCAYTSARDVLAYQMTRMFRLPTFPLLPLASLICKLRAGFTYHEASALKQVKKSRTPTLFIHGGRDKFVPTEMAHRLYEACAAPKELYVVPEADHGLAFATDPEGYAARVSRFIETKTGIYGGPFESHKR